jgi:hypothetical protein
MVELLSAQTPVQVAPRGAAARILHSLLKPPFCTLELAKEGVRAALGRGECLTRTEAHRV